MPNSNFVRFGPWKPYPRPLTPPTAGVFDEPLEYLCVNEEWSPIVIGCLKTLEKRQTWDTTDPDVLTDLRAQVTDLLSSWQDGCLSVCCCPEFELDIAVPEGYGTLAHLNAVDTEHCQGAFAEAYWGYVPYDITGSFSECTLTAVQGGLTVGIVYQKLVFFFGSLGQIYVNWTDCFDIVHQDTVIDIKYELDAITAKQVTVIGAFPFSFFATVGCAVQCSPA